MRLITQRLCPCGVARRGLRNEDVLNMVAMLFPNQPPIFLKNKLLSIVLLTRFLIMTNSFLSLLAQSVDPALGRLDYDSLSDQTLMEMLVSTLSKESKAAYQDENGAYTDIEEWYGVECDSEGTVTALSMNVSHMDLVGSLSFQFAPPKIRKIEIYKQRGLVGSLATRELPTSLEDLRIRGTGMSGTLDLTSLPMGLVQFAIPDNDFSGGCDLSALPSGLEYFSAYKNSFSGSINLSKLPATLKILDLSFNELCGEVEFGNLPESLTNILLAHNALSGSVIIRECHPRMMQVNLFNNLFDGTAVILNSLHWAQLGKNNFTSVVDESGKPHKKQRMFLDDKNSKILHIY